MATARKTAPRKATPAQTVEVSPVSAWKKPKPPLTLPSGNVMKIRNVGFEAFMKAGIIPNSLMSVVQKSIDAGKTPEVDEMVGEEQGLRDMFSLIDEVLIFVAIEPPVHRVPTKKDANGVTVDDENAREEELLYVDEVDQDDKMFIFGVTTGGTRDVEQFRREQANGLAAL